MAPFNSQRGTGRPLLRASSVTAGSRVSKGEVSQRRGNAGVMSTVSRTQLDKATVPSMRMSKMDPMNVSLDLASSIGMSIREIDGIDDIAESNRAYLEQPNDERYNSDDGLEETEEMQALKMKKKLVDRLAMNDKQLNAQSSKDEKADYEECSDVLDQDIVCEQLKRVRLFAEHLRSVSKNRTSLFARLAEPMAEEHWLLDSFFHERIVDVFRNMTELVNELPEIATAARYCTASALSDKEIIDTNESNSKTRKIAQMELFVHKVDQLIAQTQNST